MIMVQEASPEVFNAMLYRNGSQASVDFYQQSQQQFNSQLSDVGREFAVQSQQLYHQLYDSAAMRLAKAAMRKVESIFLSDEIQTITTIGHMQNAPATMRRWIMANPTLRSAYHKQEIHGYGEDYLDMYPGLVGLDHYDYRRVVDGLYQESADGSVDIIYVDEELLPGDKELDIDDIMDITNTWAAVEHAYALGKEDPTSQLNERL